MSSHHIRRKPDANQAEIIDALRRHGVFVQDLSNSGKGLPDIFTYYKDQIVFGEIKCGKTAKIKKSQIGWLGSYPGYCGIVRDEDEAFSLAMTPVYSTFTLDQNQKDKLAAYHKTMTAKEVSLSVILRLVNES